MSRYHVIAERDHIVQNPTTPEKIRRVGELLRLGPETRVLDIACGRGGPAIVLASEFRCRITGIERQPEFVTAARERVHTAGLGELVEIIEGDAAEYALAPEEWDVALCLGATFVWGGLAGTLAALVPSVKRGGRIAIGEPYWYGAPPADAGDMGFVSLAETVGLLEAAGLRAVGLVTASRDDWDRYVSRQWLAVEEWLEANPDDLYAAELRREHDAERQHYLELQRDRLGWAILVGRLR